MRSPSTPTLVDALRAAAAGAVRDVAALVLPQSCASCAEQGARVCPQCAADLAPTVQVQAVGGLRVWSGLTFEGVAARVIRSCKEDARPGLARVLAPALRAALAAAGGAAPPDARGRVIVVPVPASRRAMRTRGFRLVEVVTRAAGADPVRALHQIEVTRDQRDLGVMQREENLHGAFCASGVRGAHVVLVDDVVTSGATLREGARALAAAGAHVVGAATVAATPRLHPAGNASEDKE